MPLSLSSRNLDYIYHQIKSYLVLLGIVDAEDKLKEENNNQKQLKKSEIDLILGLIDFDTFELEQWAFEIPTLNKHFQRIKRALKNIKEDINISNRNQTASHLIFLLHNLKKMSDALLEEQQARDVFLKKRKLEEEKTAESNDDLDNRFYENKIIPILRILVNNKLFRSVKANNLLEIAFWECLYNDIRNDASFNTIVKLKNEYDAFVDYISKIKLLNAAIVPTWAKRNWKPILICTVVVLVSTTVFMMGPAGIGMFALVGLGTIGKVASIGLSFVCGLIVPMVGYGLKKICNLIKPNKSHIRYSAPISSPVTRYQKPSISRNSLSPSSRSVSDNYHYGPIFRNYSDRKISEINVQHTQKKGIRSRL